MAVTLIVNPGSTSRKYALYDGQKCVFSMFFEETGKGFCRSVTRKGVAVERGEISATTFSQSFTEVVAYAVLHKDILQEKDIARVGIRVVAPSSYFTMHRSIDSVFQEKLAQLEDVAPLHIPGLLSEITAAQKVLPDATCIGVSDSAFHCSIPEHVQTVSIPRSDAKRFDIKKFGYHGISVASIVRRLESQFTTVPERVIVCHVGGGVSITALQDGVSVANSMGYSPASGLLMGSRGGDLSGDTVAALTVQKRLRGARLYEYLYKESGFKGVAGVRDLRVVLDRASSKDEDACLALKMFTHQVRSWIAAHAVQLGGVDAVVVTATAVERNPEVRALLLSELDILGIRLDHEKNQLLIGREGRIESKESSVDIAVIKTDEMGEMARVVTQME